jgi:hypothetical protein
MWIELWILNLGMESFVRPVFDTRHVAVTPSLKALLRSVSVTLHLRAWLQCRLWRSCSEVALGSRRVLQNRVSRLCRDAPPILLVCVCIHQLLENVIFISPDNFSNWRYMTLFGGTRFFPFQAGERSRNFKANSLPCPPWKFYTDDAGKRVHLWGKSRCMSLLKRLVVGYFR